MHNPDFTEGKIIGPLLRFVFPIMFALFLQSLYGAVDLLIIGKYSDAANVSAVSTGSQLMQSVTIFFADMALGATVLLGMLLGQKKIRECSQVIGAATAMFLLLGVISTGIFLIFSETFSVWLHAPAEAFVQTSSYIRICGGGAVFIVVYNVLGSVFRGLGNSRIPLFTVAVATLLNIAGDYILVAVFHMGAAGAAVATILAQTASVIVSLLLVKHIGMTVSFSLSDIGFHVETIKKMVRIGLPVAAQDLLVGISFLIIMAIVNQFGVVASAGVGIAEKLCGFIMLVPIAFEQGLASVIAQNYGAGKFRRAEKILAHCIFVSFLCGIILGYIAFFQGIPLSRLFSDELAVCEASAAYLKGYGIDCLLTAFLFCFIGYFNGCARTGFVMLQGIIGAFLIRAPLSYLFSIWSGGSLFMISLATPCSSFFQIILCIICFIKWRTEA